MRGPDARNQVARWEKKFPPHIARAIIEDMLAHSHSAHNREVYGKWLDSHPAPIQGRTIHIEQYREAPNPATIEEEEEVLYSVVPRVEYVKPGSTLGEILEQDRKYREVTQKRYAEYIVNRRESDAD